MQNAISNERKINFAWYRIVRFSNKLVTSRENNPLNENHEFSSYESKEKSKGSLTIKRFLKMGNFISNYPKQRKLSL